MSNPSSTASGDISIVLCGQAGQGIQTVEKILTQFLKQSGYHVFSGKEYMSRVRGGMNSTALRVGTDRVSALVDRIDVLVPFHPGAFDHLSGRVDRETTVIGDRKEICIDCPEQIAAFFDIPLMEMAEAIGGKIFINIIAVGALLTLFGAEEDALEEFIRSYFSRKGRDIIEKNVKAVLEGFKAGRRIAEEAGLLMNPNSDRGTAGDILVNGAEAVGLGALSGGCNYLSSYPMSPSTGVMVFLAHQTDSFDLVVEQAEDEISAVNMALGASYAGARALVTTSGGGFALMTEGVSLAGMIETPVVIHLAQRPGPATGLPTRTSQGDLDLVLHAGHGEFPRAVFAPGTLDEGFRLTHHAFNIADRFQIPVFILTDQYFMDSYYTTPAFNAADLEVQRAIVKTEPDYKRYLLTEDGLSPRGIPGFGTGLVGVDSDEHDESAHITENLELRVRMVDKRLRKETLIREKALPPDFSGPEEFESLVVSWGSTVNAVREAFAALADDSTAHLHFSQVWPIHPDAGSYLNRAKKLIVVEGNATSQFGRLLRQETGRPAEVEILKYSGSPFSVEELAGRIGESID